jgi:hypothetical protein
MKTLRYRLEDNQHVWRDKQGNVKFRLIIPEDVRPEEMEAFVKHLKRTYEGLKKSEISYQCESCRCED